MKNAITTFPNTVIREDVRGIAEELSQTLAPLAGSTILVTGGSGFLCSYFLETIAYLNDTIWQPACRLITVDNLRSGVAERVAHLRDRPEVRFVSHDVSTRLDLEEPVHWIIHVAGIASPTFYRKYPLDTVHVNFTGTHQILEIAVRQQLP